MAESRAARGGDLMSSAVAKMQQARRIQKKWAQKDKDIDRELENLETRRRELETMRLMTRGQYKDWNEDSFWRTFVPYSRAWNMRLATMMQTKLPRELRDMVYANLWNEHSLICRHVGSPVRRVAEGSLEVDAAKITTMCDSSVLPHFLGSEYVGQATALEVVLALYKALRGHYAVTVSTQHLHSAFLEDSFLVGFHAYTFLRELSIYCKLDRYRTPPLRHRLARSCQHSDSETLSIDRVKLKADLIVLDSIIDKKNFKLKILLLQRNIRMAVLTESLGVFQGVRETFVEQGAHVQVSWSYDDNRIENYDLYEGHDTVFISIDDYFGMSYSLWERRFKQYIRFCRLYFQASHYRIENERSVSAISVNELAHGRWCDSESEKSWNEDESDEDSEFDSNADSDVDMN